MSELATPRLRLRQWRTADAAPFAALNADPEVMQFMPGALTRAQSDAFALKAQAQLVERGFGLWAVEVRAQRSFIGYLGLSAVSFAAPFTPAVEIAWRLERARWGHGYATEAARELLRFAFEDLGLHEVVSFTVPANLRSRSLMQRLGFRYDAHGDFEHPRLPAGHALRPHLLYRLSSGAWTALRPLSVTGACPAETAE